MKILIPAKEYYLILMQAFKVNDLILIIFKSIIIEEFIDNLATKIVIVIIAKTTKKHLNASTKFEII